MKKVLAAIGAGALMAAGLGMAPASASVGGDDPSVSSYDLIAGGGNVSSAMDIGDVTLTKTAEKITVKVVVNGDFDPSNSVPTLVYAVHAQAGCAIEDFPLSNGNPVPGQMAYQDSFPDGTDSFSFDLPNPGCAEPLVFVHTDAKELGGAEALSASFPAGGVPVGFKVALDTGNDPGASYFDTTFTPMSGLLSGETLNGWCVDIGGTISPGANYNGTAYSIYDLPEGPVGNIDKPENLPAVMWLLNNYAPGDLYNGVPLSSGTIQRAIWYVVDDTQSTAGLGAFDDAAAKAIAAEALMNNVLPTSLCGQIIPIIIVANTTNVQSTIVQTTLVELGLPCKTRSETAVAMNTEKVVTEGKKQVYGEQFPGSNWFSYVLAA